MKAFILQPTYRIIDNKPIVQLYGALENKESFRADFDFQPYFFIKSSQLKKAQSATLFKFESKDEGFKSFKGEEVTRIILKSPKDVPKVRQDFEKAGIQCFEADVRFAYRFLIDNDLRGSFSLKGERTEGKDVKWIYTNPEIEPAHHVPELSILSIDIETNSDASIVYCIALMQGSSKKVLFLDKEGNKERNKDGNKEENKEGNKHEKRYEHAESLPSEEALLKRFIEVVKEKDPDIITGWNVVDFDLQVLLKRCRQYKIPFTIGRSDEAMELTIQKDFFRESTAEIPGRVVLDGIHLLKTSFISLEDYRLDTAAEEFLGEKKLIDFHDKRKEIEELYKKHPQKLIDYNLKDAELVLKILEKSQVMALTIHRSLLSGMPLDRVRASIASLDSLYLREARKRKLVCPSGSFNNDVEERIKGGFVRDSIPGIYENILVLDFKSLYPSVMRSFNIDPASFIEDDSELQKHHDPKKYVGVENGAFFKNEEGILPMILKELWSEREKARKAKNELGRWAIKILMNSFWGVIASPMCRFYNLKLANGITHTCQMIIKLTAEKVKEMGYLVIYGDTDSVFVKSDAKSHEEAETRGNHIQKEINNFFKEKIKKEYHRESYLELEFEKVFVKFIMPTIRGSETGAKKRYAGIVLKDGKKELEVTGLEAIRSDWTELARDFQKELLERIFEGKDPGKYIQELVEQLRKGKLDDKLVYRKRLTKDVSEYVKTTPPHVKAARLLPEITSNIIYYLMTEKGPQPQGYVEAKLDYAHYIEKQLKPIADSILSFQGKSFDDYVKGSSQKGLGEF